MVTCRECQAVTPANARYCIGCGAPIVADGATERLELPVPLGFFRGEPIYTYSWELWCHPEFYAINPFMMRD